MLFLGSKYCNHSILKESCIIVKDNFKESIEKCIRKDTNGTDLFQKNPLDYCFEKGDRKCMYEILSLESEVHNDLTSGLLFLKENISKGELKKWVVDTYCELYKEQNFCSPWITAFIVVFLELGIFSYGIAIYDFYSDFQMLHEYSIFSEKNWKPERNLHINSTVYEHNSADIKNSFHIAYMTTMVVIIGSLFAYFINIGLSHTSPLIKKIWDVHKNTNFCIELIYEVVYFMLKLLLWPLAHMYNCAEYYASEHKIELEERNEELNNSWRQVKIWEQGVENTVQLSLSIWTLQHHLPCIVSLGMKGIIQDSIVGLENFLLFGAIEADYIQKTLGKSVMAFMFLAFSLSWMKNDKRGYSLVEKLTRMVPLFLAYLIQVFNRLIALICYIFMQTSLENDKFAVMVLIHCILVVIILITFESQLSEIKNTIKNQKNAVRKLWIITRRLVSLILRVLSSSFHLPSCNEDLDDKHTFLSQSCYQLLILIENLGLVLTAKFRPDLYPKVFITHLWIDFLIYAVVFGWVISIILRVSNNTF